jgi:hypothetical protein
MNLDTLEKVTRRIMLGVSIAILVAAGFIFIMYGIMH